MGTVHSINNNLGYHKVVESTTVADDESWWPYFLLKPMLLLDFEESGVNINTVSRSKRLGKFTDDVVLLHDNVPLHLVKLVQDLLGLMHWEVLQRPPYTPDLSPCDLHVYDPLKESLKGRRFNSDAEVEFAVGE